MEEARESVDKMLTELGLDPYRRECDCVSEVNFRRLKAMLDAIDDVDHLWLEEVAKEGVSLGVDEELPRVERVFEEKEKLELEFHRRRVPGCHSGKLQVSREQLCLRQEAHEVALGSIVKMDHKEAEKLYKGHLAVAALGCPRGRTKVLYALRCGKGS